jgi:type VI protein secretion system component Hcp
MNYGPFEITLDKFLPCFFNQMDEGEGLKSGVFTLWRMPSISYPAL